MATKPFSGKDTKAEERKEAKLVKSGKVTPAQYAKKEKAEGHKGDLLARGKKLAAGKMSGASYAKKFGK